MLIKASAALRNDYASILISALAKETKEPIWKTWTILYGNGTYGYKADRSA